MKTKWLRNLLLLGLLSYKSSLLLTGFMTQAALLNIPTRCFREPIQIRSRPTY